MKTEQTEAGKILKMTVKEAATYAFFLVTATASLMGIFGRFQTVEKNAIPEKAAQELIDTNQNIRIEYVNKRIDAKFNQLKSKKE